MLPSVPAGQFTHCLADVARQPESADARAPHGRALPASIRKNAH
jgi:hypothetical protein